MGAQRAGCFSVQYVRYLRLGVTLSAMKLFVLFVGVWVIVCYKGVR